MAVPSWSAGESLNAILDHRDLATPALIVPEDGEVLSYGQLADRVGQLAGCLAAAGVRRGDRVAFTLPNGPDVVQVLLAITALGAAAAPLNPAYTESEYAFYLSDIAPRLLLLPDTRPAAAAAAAAACEVSTLTLRGGAGEPPVLFANGSELAPLDKFEPGQADDVG